MKRFFRPRLIALIAGLTALATLVPAAFAQQSPAPNGPIPSGDESVLFLTRSSKDFVEWGTFEETITTRKNDCTAIFFNGDDLATIEATGGGVLGDVKDGFGELGINDGSGEPCGRIDAPDQGVSFALSGELSRYAMTAIDLDLELKFGAIALIEFRYNGQSVGAKIDQLGGNAELDGGKAMFDSNAPTGDDGPDSKDGDNYRVIARPESCEEGVCSPVFFDEIVITAKQGAVSLEGGADFEGPNPEGTAYGSLFSDPNDRNSLSSQFEVVRVFDGTLNCGDEVVVGDGENTPKAEIKRTAYGEDADGNCVLKYYDLDSLFDDDQPLENSILFSPTSEETVVARYTADLTSVPYSSSDENPVTQTIEYDPDLDGIYQTMQWCLTDPGAGWATVTDSTTVLPSGESWCITGSDTNLRSDGSIQTIWSVIGQDDPGFRFG